MAGGGGQSLEETPTWAVAVVCFVIVAISIFIEELIHLVGRWLKKHKKEELFEALEKIKAELMLLGFISLLLTVGQSLILKICVPPSVGESWHPCGPHKRMKNSGKLLASVGRRLVQKDGYGPFRRVLASYGEDKCAEKGKVPLISTYGIHQLHIFIFVLALFHVLYCITTMALGRLKMRRWKSWEKETKTVEYQYSHDPERFRFARETSFGRRHLNFWTRSPILIWIVCFFRQFVRSVPKVDYLTLRHGFIMAHLSPQSSVHFDFQQYIKKSLENDFKVVVGISPVIWLFAVIFLLFNTHGWYSYFWLPFIPLIIVLAVGTKLQVVITRMALEITERGDIVKGVPVVHPADKHFWFYRPQLMLNLIHFVLFQNAFQVAFFFWSWFEYGLHSCFHETNVDIIIRLTMGISVQILCSYVTLPLYALVTQMGTNMKPVIFNQRVANALRHWHHTARKHVKQNRKSGSVTASPATSRPQTPPHALSPLHLLQHYQRDVDMDIDSYQASPNHHHRYGDGFLDRSGFNSESSSIHHTNARTEGEAVVEMQGIGDLPPQYEESKHVAGNFSFDKRYQRR